MTLSVHDLTITRGGIPVLEGLNFALEPGRALVVRGPNGVGKTTLLRTVAALQPPVNGRVECPPESIAYAAHSDGLKAMLSVTENLMFWADVFGTKDISAAITTFDLEGLSERMAGTLSAGQKRRLGLARLLVTGRPIWVLDEPTVSLDTASVQMFAEAVRTHLKSGGSALMATHIDLGLEEADVLDVGPFRAKPGSKVSGGFDEGFL
ncbi:heme ABC exporter ATP-binding protein CcmA [Shimia sp.]|uniref:heme ABC exporter ATP-binding protein CcmA n=1 Tax=Shimia sp. TaxID=1954381 RepID=UPI0032985EE8